MIHNWLTTFLASLKLSYLNSLPNHKILGLTEWKAFADNKFNVGNMMIFLFNSIKNIAVT